MLQITRTTISKEASEIVENFSYNLQISIQDNALNSISCQISKKVLVDMQVPDNSELQKVEQIIQVGIIQLANGQLTSQINQDEDSITHLTKMSEYVTEIKNDLAKSVKK